MAKQVDELASGQGGDERWKDVRPTYQNLARLIPNRELWVIPEISWSEFFRWPYEYRAYLTLECGLRPDHRVLELGCGSGRTMLGLHDYLKPPGAYEGLDVGAHFIDFAQKNIQAKYPYLRFTHADVYHAVYNPGGSASPEEYVFPYPDEHFDVAFAASLFTHLLPGTAANYLKEARRVLKPGGRCLFSCLVLDGYRDAIANGKTPMWKLEDMAPDEAGLAVKNPDSPEDLIAYSLARINEIAAGASLEVERVLPGYWTYDDRQS
ncbi:MAG TPA: class I SAM-dependent methyltransferase, partial [Candidatus Dormibacteraeota bacterium]|nr:class I SAM-dependent methyltransferase [Candidatus Dormibacteraeota bacterium]